eukprot:CAMPEP_0202896248 /NCGR_PEP_ID=MMETSP1392-20130828/5266_1 /ASSEMBLY_ACC=CAM_ASM_000868 /TAXON_ID=225041 /ORGANISM="Chlamydomonas chlamydogama, Strain SAG 11-48b" /LENGTH=777 /DNA_ID=CAMNT_0049581523 /DNA_START=303 /DNA_END=2636 /DNA_ORIENTATION=+
MKRYGIPQYQRQALPEAKASVYEALVGSPIPIYAGLQGICGPAPVYIALVDTAGEEDFIELVRSALLAALEALPPGALFGLITFSNKLGLHDLRSPTPAVRYIPIFESQPLLVPLAELMPLPALLTPVGAFKESITAALEALEPEQSIDRTRADASTAQPSGSANGTAPAVANGTAPPAAPGTQAPMHRGLAHGNAMRGFGAALLGVLDYLRGLQQPPFTSGPEGLGKAAVGAGAQAMADMLPPAQSPVHLLTFLSGLPDLGPGRLINPRKRRTAASLATQVVRMPENMQGSNGSVDAGSAAAQLRNLELQAESWQEDVSPQTRQFYEQASVAAASLGVCVDMFAISAGAVGLPVMEPVCNASGGAIYLYTSVDESALPQDVYRRLSGQHASAGLLRVRTSAGFKPVRVYGRLFADQQFDNLHHIISCDTSDTFAMDFEFTSKEGFLQEGVVTPTVQVAFQYTAVVPVSPTGGENGESAGGARESKGAHMQLQRRIRVATMRLAPSSDALEVLRNASTDAVVAVLMHKIMKAARAQGAAAARQLLRDWLVILATNYHRTTMPTASPQQLLSAQVDLNFVEAPPLQRLPRLVYALLRSPLLAPPAPGQHPDLTAFIEHLWACLPPQELITAVYPVLSSYSDPDTLALPRHSLSQAALLSSPAPIFLLDAYILVMVFYTARCPPTIPFPPPQSSALRKAIGAIRADRKISPMLRFAREGTEEAELFSALLLDEAEGHAPPGQSQGGGESAMFGLVQFLEHIRTEVGTQLRGETALAERK